MADLPHLHPQNTSNKEPYQTPRSGGPSLALPPRERAEHGAALRAQLQQVQAIPAAPEREVILQFESEPNFKLQLNSLESRNQGIELLSVRLGSIHSDRWTGTAVELAERGYIGIFPVVGWWRERHQLGRWDRSARYALVISISTPGTEVDIYTPVAAQIQILTQIPT